MTPIPAEYVVEACSWQELNATQRARCVELVEEGGAVMLDPDELPLAQKLVVARMLDLFVGVGVIKRLRADYARKIAKRSRHDFPDDTPELGYVAVDPPHQGNKLSSTIVDLLLYGRPGPHFATTDKPKMKVLLEHRGFAHVGNQWKGNSGKLLSLWWRDALLDIRPA